MKQGGIAEGIVESIQACHPDMHQYLYQNILITGGSSSFPHFKERLEQEVRALVPSQFQVNILMPQQ